MGDELRVTGRPASPEFLGSLLNGCEWEGRPSSPLEPGQVWTSPDGRHRIVNLDWEPPAPSLAALSDHPEKVDRVGGLFFGGLTRLRTLNFQYYHLGELSGPSPNLSLYLTNSGSEPAVLYWRKGIGKPSLDYFSTGHTNNLEWLTATEQNLGSFVTVEPGKMVRLFKQDLPPEYVVGGTLGLTLMDGPPLDFAWVARRSVTEKPSFNNLLKEDDVHSRGFYPASVQRIERAFQVGQEPMNLSIGAVRQQTFSGVRELRGDYGVTYQAELELYNPTSEEARVEFVFNPRGGAATGTFLIDGRVIEVSKTEAFAENLFHSVVLDAGEKKIVKLVTIPEGASSYPVRIIIR